MSEYTLIARSNIFTVPAVTPGVGDYGQAIPFVFDIASIAGDGYFYSLNSQSGVDSQLFFDNTTILKSVRIESMNVPGLRLSWDVTDTAPILQINREATGGVNLGTTIQINEYGVDIPIDAEVKSATAGEKFRFKVQSFEVTALTDLRNLQTAFEGVTVATLQVILVVECAQEPT